MTKKISKVVMSKSEIDRSLKRIAQEILEKNKESKDIVFVGILGGGLPIARRIAEILEKNEGIKIPIGAIDISFYRDDLSIRGKNISPKRSDIPFSINNKIVILVDDVLFHGRTVRAALDALNDYGRPKKVQLAVLIDRGYRELPIQPDFCGKRISVGFNDKIIVKIGENNLNDNDSVIVETQS